MLSKTLAAGFRDLKVLPWLDPLFAVKGDYSYLIEMALIIDRC